MARISDGDDIKMKNTEEQKKNKVHNLLSKLKKKMIIKNERGRGVGGSYVLIHDDDLPTNNLILSTK